MSPQVSVPIFLRRRGRESALWIAGVGASGLLAMGVYATAGQPFNTTLGDPLALPAELVVTSGNATIPLPPELAESLATAPSKSEEAKKAIPTTTVAPKSTQQNNSSVTTQAARNNNANDRNNSRGNDTTQAPTTPVPSTNPPTTAAPTTEAPTTSTPPTTSGPKKNTQPNQKSDLSKTTQNLINNVPVTP